MRIAQKTAGKGARVLWLLGFRRMRQGLALMLTAAWTFLIYKVLRRKAEQEGRKSPLPLDFRNRDRK